MKHYHKRHLWYRITISLFSSIIGALFIFALFFINEDTPEEYDPRYLIYLIFIYLGVQILSVIYISLSWHFTTYELTDEAIILRKGIIIKIRKNLPYDKIHAIDYKQNLIEKLFRIKKLSLDSGATVNAEMAEIVIVEDNDEVTELTKAIQLKKDSQYIEKKPKEKAYFYKFSIIQKLLDALIKSSIVIMLFGLLLVTMLTLSYFFDPEYTPTRIIEAIYIFIIGALITFGGVLLYLVIRYYHYQVKFEDKYIIISYGILKKVHNTLALNRIKAVKLEESLIRRIFKLCAIKLELVGFGSVSDNYVFNYYIPFCTKKEIGYYIDQLQLDYKYHDCDYHAPRSSFRYFYSLPLLIFTIIYLSFIPIIFIYEEALYLYLGGYIIIVLLIIFGSLLAHANSGLYFDDHEVIIYGGVFTKKSTIILNQNITGIDMVDTYLRNRRQVASFNIHYYNNAIRNVEVARLLDRKLYNELINVIRY